MRYTLTLNLPHNEYDIAFAVYRRADGLLIKDDTQELRNFNGMSELVKQLRKTQRIVDQDKAVFEAYAHGDMNIEDVYASVLKNNSIKDIAEPSMDEFSLWLNDLGYRRRKP